eukprot:3011268-Pyramimonas_sp.AAC.1
MRRQIAFHSFPSDAANSAVWRKSKVHATEVQSGFIYDVGDIMTIGDFDRSLESMGMLCDIQRALSGTAGSTYSLLKKQLSSFVCPLWAEQFPAALYDAF